MPGLVPGIYVFLSYATKTWMAGTSPAMTVTSAMTNPESAHVLHCADPAGMGEVENDAERVLVFGLVIGVPVGGLPGRRRFGTSGEITAARLHHLLFGLVEVIDPHAEMIDADRLVALLFEQRDVHRAVGNVKAAPGLARNFHVESLFEELGGFFRIGNDERDVAKLGHDLFPCWCLGWRTIARNRASSQAAQADILTGAARTNPNVSRPARIHRPSRQARRVAPDRRRGSAL